MSCVRESDGQSVSPYLCPIETRPVLLTRTCNDVPCPPRWNYSDFQECSKPCGIGIQLRDVTCIHEVARGGGNTVVVPNFMCPQPPPQDRQSCNVLDCPVKWHPAEWSKVKSLKIIHGPQQFQLTIPTKVKSIFFCEKSSFLIILSGMFSIFKNKQK